MIAADMDERDAAALHAQRALEAAAKEHSGFRYHASVGLVSEEYEEVIRKLEAYRAA